MKSVRRMGSENSATSDNLLDAVERVLRNEGYGAATSRRVAEEAGVKQQLVYYYFKTMDDLLLAAFKRRTKRELEKMRQVSESARPIHAFWQDLSSNPDAKLAFEFVALGNRHDGIRTEVAEFLVQARKIQSSAIERHWKAKGIDSGPLSAGAAAFLLYTIGLLLGREEAGGVTEAHHDVRELVRWALGQFA